MRARRPLVLSSRWPVILCAISASLSSACLPTPEVRFGRKFDSAHVPDIRACVTTQENLLAWFGEPFTEGNENGFPTLQWTYTRMRMGVGSAESKSEAQTLVVVLNRDRKVVHVTLNPMGVTSEVRDVCAGAGDASTP